MKRAAWLGLAGAGALVLALDTATGRFSTFRRVFSREDLSRRLVHAVWVGGMDQVRLLLRRGADPNRLVNDTSPLHAAARQGRGKIAALLIANGARVNTRTPRGLTPLHVAAMEGYRDVFDLLLTGGADVSAVTVDGETPLHFAAVMGRSDFCARLLEKGADVNARTHAGETPLSLVALHGYDRVTEVLVAKGADLNAGRPLHVAASKGEQWVVGFLLAHGADVNAKDENGRTPLDRAMDDPTRALLRKHGAVPGFR